LEDRHTQGGRELKKPSLQAALHDPAEMLKRERVYPLGNFAALSLMLIQVNERYLHSH